ncbi:MAG: NAD(P)-binding domain-containing protein [Micromonosporaceae bacterium]
MKDADSVDVAIVGAGPYGLSVAAHLRRAAVQFRLFGSPMNLWRSAMPRGMYLKSQGFASNLSDPDGTHTLEAFCRLTGRPYADYGLPVALDTFVEYGMWFQAELAPALEDVQVTELAKWNGGYRLALSNGDSARARKVILAIGVEHFAHVPPTLSALPSELCTHSSAHSDLTAFEGRSVIVVGAGQSALESAALLHENRATVQLVAREPQISWNGEPLLPDRPLLRRLREPEAGLGSGWATWFYSTHPNLFRHLSTRTRVHRAWNALGPAGAPWLRSRVEGKFPILTGHALSWAESRAGRVHLGVVERDCTRHELSADHVIAATGYRMDLRRLLFVEPQLRSQLKTVAGTPSVGRDYESSVPGLYIIGPVVAPTFGPVIRFVYGTDHAASMVARSLADSVGRRPAAMVGADR